MKVRLDVVDEIIDTEYEARGDAKKPKGKVVKTRQPDDGNMRLTVPLGVLVKFKKGQKQS
ncbi:hypothetical protein HYU19_01575 [Candidatus Woesearchaeota archaeon]|nr:hypothetical protein [Candidatus Woesearchaeota archaeon]